MNGVREPGHPVGPAGPSDPAAPDEPPGPAAPGPELAALLDRTVRRSLGWLEEQRAYFRLPQNVTGDADPNRTLKPLGELAELALVTRELHPLRDVRERGGALFAFAWEETRGGELFAELIRGEPRATYPVELYGVFAQAGMRNAAVEALLPAVTGLRGWRVAREDHTRTLSVLNAERRIGLPQHSRFRAEFALTGLGRTQEPWTLDLRAAYGVTHDVFHLTDWGRSRERTEWPFAEYLRLWLPCWLECWLEEEVWDLAGELLAVAGCLPQAVLHPAAWARLAAVQDLSGALPETGALPASCDGAEAFLRCYHSTLVTMFAATLARAGCEPPEDGNSGARQSTRGGTGRAGPRGRPAVSSRTEREREAAP